MRFLNQSVSTARADRRQVSGFTLVELVVTMIIVGILAVTVLPRFDHLGAFDAAGFADQTQSLLRYAQKSAIAQRRWVAVDVAAPVPLLCSQTDIVAGCSSDCAGGANRQPLPLPGGSPRSRQDSTAFKAGSNTVLCFDALGRPIASGGTAPMTVAASLTVQDGSSDFRTIRVEHETGYVR